jgi:hypothetical protein
LDSRELTPGLVKKIVFAGAECRSEKRSQVVLEQVGDCQVSIKTIERVLHDVGSELKSLRDGPPSRLPTGRSGRNISATSFRFWTSCTPWNTSMRLR